MGRQTPRDMFAAQVAMATGANTLDQGVGWKGRGTPACPRPELRVCRQQSSLLHHHGTTVRTEARACASSAWSLYYTSQGFKSFLVGVTTNTNRFNFGTRAQRFPPFSLGIEIRTPC